MVAPYRFSPRKALQANPVTFHGGFFWRIIARCHENPRAPNGATLGDSRTYLRPPGRAAVTSKRVCEYTMMCSGNSHCASAVEVPTRTPSWHSQRRERGENTSCGGAPGGGPAPKAARMLARAAAGCRRACAALGAADRPVGAEDQWAKGRENTRGGARARADHACAAARCEPRDAQRLAGVWAHRYGVPRGCAQGMKRTPRPEEQASQTRSTEMHADGGGRVRSGEMVAPTRA